MLKFISIFLLTSFSLLGQYSNEVTSTLSDQWLVKLDDNSMKEIMAKSSDSNIELLSVGLNLINFKSELPITKDIVGDVFAPHSILGIYPNYKLEKRETIPDDFHFSSQWNMNLLQLPQVWDFNSGGKLRSGQDIVVAVLDIGFQIDHVDIVDNYWTNNNEIPNDGVDNDGNGVKDDYYGFNVDTQNDNHYVDSHGTKVSGIIGAKGNNGRGVAGVNWNVKILPIGGVDRIGKIIVAMEYLIMMKQKFIASNGVEGANILVTNLSAGVPKTFPEESLDWCRLYDLAGAVGILSVSAAPNDFTNVDIEGDLPTLCESDFLITVTNTDQSDLKVRSSGYGPKHVDLGAPGENVFTTTLNDTYGTISGTSGSTPHVSGAIALLYSLDCEQFEKLIENEPVESALLVKDAILSGVESNISLEETLTGGRLNVYNSFLKLADWCTGRVASELAIEDIKYTATYLEITMNTNIYSEHNLSVHDINGKLIYDNEFIPDPFGSGKIRVYYSSIIDLTLGNYVISITNEIGKSSELFTIVR